MKTINFISIGARERQTGRLYMGAGNWKFETKEECEKWIVSDRGKRQSEKFGGISYLPVKITIEAI